MEDLLRRLLCIDGGDTDMASLLMSHGAQLQEITFLKLLTVFESSEFCADKLGVLRRYPQDFVCILELDKVLKKRVTKRPTARGISALHCLTTCMQSRLARLVFIFNAKKLN